MLKAPSAPGAPLFPRVRYAPPALLSMRQAMDDRRRTLAAQEAELRVMMTKNEKTEDMAANVETSTTNDTPQHRRLRSLRCRRARRW